MPATDSSMSPSEMVDGCIEHVRTHLSNQPFLDREAVAVAAETPVALPQSVQLHIAVSVDGGAEKKMSEKARVEKLFTNALCDDELPLPRSVADYLAESVPRLDPLAIAPPPGPAVDEDDDSLLRERVGASKLVWEKSPAAVHRSGGGRVRLLACAPSDFGLFMLDEDRYRPDPGQATRSFLVDPPPRPRSGRVAAAGDGTRATPAARLSGTPLSTECAAADPDALTQHPSLDDARITLAGRPTGAGAMTFGQSRLRRDCDRGAWTAGAERGAEEEGRRRGLPRRRAAKA